MNTLSWLVGLRYLSARKDSRFVSLFSLASILGMTISVLAMVVVLSVMNGFESEVRQRILHAVPHAQLTAPGGMADWQQTAAQVGQMPGVIAVSPQDRARVLLASPAGVRGGELYGVDPQQEAEVSDIDQYLISGQWADLRAGEYGVVLGRSLARQLGVAVGDGVTLMLPRVSVTPLGLFPRSRRFTVVGIFAVGAQLDSTQLYIHLDDAARLLRTGGKVDALRLRFKDVLSAPAELEILRAQPALGGFDLKSWRDEHRTLFNAIRMEKIMVSLMLAVIVAVAVFNLVSILTMAVADRRTDIAVLRTLGASRGTIVAIFLIYGMLMGAAGIGFGATLGSALALNLGSLTDGVEQLLAHWLPNANTLFIVHLPSEWQAWQVMAIVLMSLLLCLCAVFYPAWRASLIHPAEALRYE